MFLMSLKVQAACEGVEQVQQQAIGNLTKNSVVTGHSLPPQRAPEAVAYLKELKAKGQQAPAIGEVIFDGKRTSEKYVGFIEWDGDEPIVRWWGEQQKRLYKTENVDTLKSITERRGATILLGRSAKTNNNLQTRELLTPQVLSDLTTYGADSVKIRHRKFPSALEGKLVPDPNNPGSFFVKYPGPGDKVSPSFKLDEVETLEMNWLQKWLMR